jgi:RNA polymerase sigma-70 factor (ECF subfamily)
MLSDTQLVSRLQTGDTASFEVLFLRHYERIYGVLYRLLGNQADAEDIAQQVFMKLYDAPRRIEVETEANVTGWLYRVAINTGYNLLRSRRRRVAWHEKLGRFWPFDTFAPDPSDTLERQEAQDRVRRVLALMKPRDAKLLLLRHSGLSYQAVAAALDLAPGSIGSLLTRAEVSCRFWGNGGCLE